MMTIQVFCCDPWASYIAQLDYENQVVWREYNRELDKQRELELNPPIEAADVEYVDLTVAIDLNLVTHYFEVDRRASGGLKGRR